MLNVDTFIVIDLRLIAHNEHGLHAISSASSSVSCCCLYFCNVFL